ncbi:MAG: type secretion system secreted protein Hcp [Acidimicrobiaceae bacterium]|nr:type secretion system secreted protein Hcp [Acidimicrobiaceae bacterium]
MATDTFLKTGDIKGDSIDSRHVGEIEVLSWSWGVTQTGSTVGSGGGKHRVHFNDFSFTHHVDRASPHLMTACATGEHLKEAILTVRKAGKGQQEFLVVTMSDVIVTSVLPAGRDGEDALFEQASLQFAKVDLEYKPQKPDGSLDAGIHFKFNIKGNKKG